VSNHVRSRYLTICTSFTALLLAASLGVACGGCQSPFAVPTSVAVPIGTASAARCPAGWNVIDFDGQLWPQAKYGQNICQSGETVTLTSPTTVRFVAADGGVFTLGPPERQVGGACG
jgi:hypothetical protein